MTEAEAEGSARLLAALALAVSSPAPARIGVAVSGGGDSMALLDLAQRVFPGRVCAATVDHGLRVESAEEARAVAAFCAERNIPHEILGWSGPKASGNLMDQARQARRGLLAQWAQGQGVGDILLGHTADEQAETLLMNLARAAGLDGLCGLRPRWDADGVTWHRPLLDVSRADLRRYLIAQGIGWVDDPSNENDRFTRARMRKALAALAPMGLGPEVLAQSARHLASARAALQEVAADAARTHIMETAAALTIDARAFQGLTDEIQRRLLLASLRWMGGAAHPPRESQLARLRAALQGRRDATLGGLRFLWSDETFVICRELRATEGPVPLGQTWDYRWRLSGPPLSGAEVRALGADGLRACGNWQAHGPRHALVTSPALWLEDRLIAAPLAGFCGPYAVTLSQGFAEFILSH